MQKLWTSWILLIVATSLSAQFLPDVRRSVKMEAQVASESPSVTISWVEDEAAISHQLYRRAYPEGEWGAPIASYQAGVDTYVDTAVAVNTLYEYRVVKTSSDYDSLGYGYLLSGIELEPRHQQGELLIVLTQSTVQSIESILQEYRELLSADGWPNRLRIVANTATVVDVKELISQDYAADPFTAVLILGDVPIPHAGNINPDGHNDHKGAWSADVYYGDLDGEWTDEVVNNVTSSNPRNHNVPGDQRWDQSYIPSEVEVAVGRVDFSQMPAFAEDEYELLRQYLNKDMAYRQGDLPFSRRGMVRNVNSWDGGLGQNGIRNFSVLVSPDSVGYGEWQSVFSQSYQWFYGASAGNFTQSFMQGSTALYAAEDFQAVFTAWFGSRFGDYDYPDAFMRSHLGSGTVLSSVWAGAPHWYFHAMGMGFPLATATLATQNNDTRYEAGYFPRSIHVNLLGDPTLKAYPFRGADDLTANGGQGFIDLQWTEAPGPVSGYYLYRRAHTDSQYVLIDFIEQHENQYRDDCLEAGVGYQYLLRASRLETTASGSFYNLSVGVTVTTEIVADNRVLSDFVVLDQSASVLTLVENSTNADSLLWLFPDGTDASDSQVSYELDEGGNLIQLVAINRCGRDTTSQNFFFSGTSAADVDQLELYPNPAQDKISLSLPHSPSRIDLFSGSGQLLRTWSNVQSRDLNLSVGDLPAGRYWLAVQFATTKPIGRWVVLR